ncbi:MAG: hypothetical protein ACYDHM_03915 [Acidiferrobacterales bacterium]
MTGWAPAFRMVAQAVRAKPEILDIPEFIAEAIQRLDANGSIGDLNRA